MLTEPELGWSLDRRPSEVLRWPGTREFVWRFWYYYVERTRIFQYRLPFWLSVKLAAGTYD